MKHTKILSIALLLIISCTNTENILGEDELVRKPAMEKQQSSSYDIVGTRFSIASVAMQAAYNRFVNSLRKNDAISIIAEVDHEQNAQSVEMELQPTRVVFFGNPSLGTPLMQENQLAGLDLPQHVLYFKDEASGSVAMYNSVDYLTNRYNLEGVGTLDQIAMALEMLVSDATKSDVKTAADNSVSYLEGIIIKESTMDFDATYTMLRNSIADNQNLRIVAELDHQANAMSVGLELRPTSIIIFGNPALGTPLMKDNQTAGLDLPQKMLVYEDVDGNVFVAYNDPYYLKKRHMLKESDEEIEKISNALDNISNAAIGL